MRSGTLISVEEYLATSYRRDCEYVDGALVERNVREFDHSRLQTNLATYLRIRERQWGILAVTEQRVQVKPERFRVPDICVVKRNDPIEQIFTRPPFLCIEILSRDDSMSEMQDRIDDYLAFGSLYVWLLDPRRKSAYIYTAGEIRRAKDGILRTSDPDIAVPLAELFD